MEKHMETTLMNGLYRDYYEDAFLHSKLPKGRQTHVRGPLI